MLITDHRINTPTYTHLHTRTHTLTCIASRWLPDIFILHLSGMTTLSKQHSLSTVQSFLAATAQETDIKQCYVQYRSLGAIIAPLVSLGWFPAPSLWPLLWCFPWARLFARIEPPSLLGSPETSRSSTLEFSSQNLKNKQDVAEQSLMLHFFLFNLSYF